MNIDDVKDPFYSYQDNLNKNSNCFGGLCNIFNSNSIKSIIPLIFIILILILCFCKKN